jgi:hypothetical protein
MNTDYPAIGRVFTPLSWAKWLVKRSGAYRLWQEGGTVLDPTCGDGAFLEAFIAQCMEEENDVSKDSLSRLFGIEINLEDKASFLGRMQDTYSIDFPHKNFLCCDILNEHANIVVDFVIGNPPWSNFSDLPQFARDQWAKAFIGHGLVNRKKDVLLGKSRADLAALVMKKSIDVNLKPGGKASFFAPLSTLFNDGANNLFRPYPDSEHGYSIVSVWDFEEKNVFNGIATRYGAIDFAKGLKQTWPVKTWVQTKSVWRESLSTSCDLKSGGWVRHEKGSSAVLAPRIPASADSKPRQGVNTCGANDVFIFKKTDNGLLDSFGNVIDIEEQILFPLMDKSIFDAGIESSASKSKWILIPHDKKTGRTLSWSELSEFPKCKTYLRQHEHRLKNRKGTIIRGSINKGNWWSLLGVGRYSFSRWKVAWEALGKKAFRPVLLDGVWQGNQAMHAFCPCSTWEEGIALLEALKRREVEDWLKSFSMEGTCNWAQPGKVSKVFEFEGEQLSLF